MRIVRDFFAIAALLATVTVASADESFATVAGDVNQKLVKLFGAGGFKGLVSYGTGVVVSPEGHVLTVASHMLDTQDLRVHLADGRRFHANIVVIEPPIAMALVKVELGKTDGELPFFD